MLTDAAFWLIATTSDAWDATAGLRARAATTWHTRPTLAQRTRQIAATAAAVLLVLALAVGLVVGVVHLVVLAVTSLLRGIGQAALGVWHSEAADAARAVADIPLAGAATWLHRHALGLPATPAQIGTAALGLAIVLFISARRGSTAARLAFAALGAAACTAVWQATPDGQRTVAVAVSAGTWLLFAPSAYAARWRPERLTRLVLPPALEEALAAYASASTPAPTPATAQPSVPVPPARVGSGFRCRHCHQPLAWSDSENDDERTWRTTDGQAACPNAPTNPALHHAM